jgi:RHS repeat-associated protein
VAGARGRYDYLPFGKPYDAGTSVDLGQRYTYTGREENPAGALMCYRYRLYDARVGLFTAVDPLGRAMGTPLLYTYCLQSPSAYRDQFGLAWEYRVNAERVRTGKFYWFTTKQIPISSQWYEGRFYDAWEKWACDLCWQYKVYESRAYRWDGYIDFLAQKELVVRVETWARDSGFNETATVGGFVLGFVSWPLALFSAGLSLTDDIRYSTRRFDEYHATGRTKTVTRVTETMVVQSVAIIDKKLIYCGDATGVEMTESKINSRQGYTSSRSRRGAQ